LFYIPAAGGRLFGFGTILHGSNFLSASWPSRREAFPRAPCQDAGENENGHVLVKQIGNHGKDEVTVIFQHWIKSRTLDALFTDRQAESGRAQS
jgi:hypothetical protein